ncbi:MAG: hypothetical protein LQ351_001607 [Letrouitia transgressa]|nr:MAG: hypothetical protein LQ351_001607 [Letrouitia transgressa]
MPPLRGGTDALWRALCPLSYRSSSRVQSIFLIPLRKPSSFQCRSVVSQRTQDEIEISSKPLQGEDYNIRKHLYQGISFREQPSPGHLGYNPNKDEAYETLRRASQNGDYFQVQKLLALLVQQHNEKPNLKLYRAALLANTDPQHGSAANVLSLLEEMLEEGLIWDSGVCHAAIKALAIHPNYLLRWHVLEELRKRWFTLSEEGWHDVIAGLIKDKQIEIAFDTLELFQREGIRVQRWLYDVFIYNLCDACEFDAALSIMRHRVNNGDLGISGTIWAYFLDAASREYHLEATEYAYRKRVEPGYWKPPSGVCLNILNTAARYGHYPLATDIFSILAKRSQTIQTYHYEGVIEAYLNGGDLKSALTLVVLMGRSETPPTEGTTREIYKYIRSSPELCSEALGQLKGLKSEKRPIPAVAINCVIDAYIHLNDLKSAVDTYKILHTVCPTGPTTHTFNSLFRGCRDAVPPRRDQAMSLASEMVALKVHPDALTYDRLILVCLMADADDMEDAWRYYNEAVEMRLWPRTGTLMALARKGCPLRDKRVWGLPKVAKVEGKQEVALRALLNELWVKEGDRSPNSNVAEEQDTD